MLAPRLSGGAGISARSGLRLRILARLPVVSNGESHGTGTPVCRLSAVCCCCRVHACTAGRFQSRACLPGPLTLRIQPACCPLPASMVTPGLRGSSEHDCALRAPQNLWASPMLVGAVQICLSGIDQHAFMSCNVNVVFWPRAGIKLRHRPGRWPRVAMGGLGRRPWAGGLAICAHAC